MKILILEIALISCASLLRGAAIVTCTSGYQTDVVTNGTCLVGSGPDVISYFGAESVEVEANVFSAQSMAFEVFGPVSGTHDLGNYPLTANAEWSETFTLPQSDPNDILKITYSAYGTGSEALVNIGQVTYTQSNSCSVHAGNAPVCINTATELASLVPSIGFSGRSRLNGFAQPCDSSFDCQLAADNTKFSQDLTVERFLPDGVTPDPFTETPEPSTISLMLVASVGLGVGSYWGIRSQLLRHVRLG